MSRSVHTSLAALGVLATLAALSLPAPLSAQDPGRALARLQFRSIGPVNMGGRVSDVDGVPGDPRVLYVSGADGGIFKSTNGGTTFTEIFNDQPFYSIGALHVAPSDPNVLWVGTGEGDPRNSTSYGNGVYRSLNGGETWMHVGLPDSERIKRIAVDPRDADVAYVCALGHAWGPNEERGVFRTRDGGATWTKVLYVDQDTGCSDLDMDLSNPRILFAGMWTHRRRPWHFQDGGKETAVYRSMDGGDTWEKLAVSDAPMARIGVAVAQSDPRTVYVLSEIPDMKGSLWRSDDRGATWRVVNTDPNINFRPFYYSDIRVAPDNPEVLYALSGGLSKSTDGGRTFERIAR
ncbi:MAG: sialidase, partial [Gemmatimonadota bacterium]|nr:sialidase [Gemmatimonadota bacterium]